jgi:hypothetical protein
LTPRLARLNYDTAEAARTVVASLITPGPAAVPQDVMPSEHGTLTGNTRRSTTHHSRLHAARMNGYTTDGEAAGAGRPGMALRVPVPSSGAAQLAGRPGNGRQADPGEGGKRDAQLIAAAASLLAEATRRGERLSQAGLAEKLRSQGYGIANERLRWLLAEASDLAADHHPGSEPPQHDATPTTAERSGQQPMPPTAASSRINGDARDQAAPQYEQQPGQAIDLLGAP